MILTCDVDESVLALAIRIRSFIFYITWIKIMNLEERLLEIERHRKLYWELDSPELSDEEYDKILSSFKEQVYKLPNGDVKQRYLNFLNGIEGTEPTNKVKLDSPMLSVSNIFTYDGVRSWCQNIARTQNEYFNISVKLDGLASFYDGKKLITRGNRNDVFIGGDISHVLKIVEFKNNLETNNKSYNELLIPLDCFEKYNVITKRLFDKTYKNTRSMVSAIVKMLPEKIDLLHNNGVKITALNYDVYKFKVQYTQIMDNGFIENIVEKFLETAKNHNIPCDGVVFELADIDYFKSLGHNNSSWYGRVCYKPSDESKRTKVTGIKLSPGKGVLTPVVHIEPVKIDGIKITKVSGFNFKYILDNKLSIGDEVDVVRKASATPEIKRIYHNENNEFLFPETCGCPENSRIVYKDPYFECCNPNCQESTKKKIIENLKLLGVSSIGSKTVEKIVIEFNVKTVFDFLRLGYNDFLMLSGFGASSARKAIDSIKKATSEILDYKVLSCCNIPGINVTIFKSITEQFTIDEILEFDISDFSKLPNIGETRGELIFYGLKDSIQFIENMRKYYKVINSKGTQSVAKNGSICFSGTFPVHQSHYEKLCKEKGFVIAQNVTKSLSYLVYSGPRTTKYETAKSYGIKIVTLDEFNEFIKNF
jgi:DNA ligase (NAD+)